MVTIAPSRKPSQRGGLPGRPYSVAEVNRPHPFPLPHPPSLRYGAVRRGYRVEAKRRRKERELASTAPRGRDGMLPSLITETATRGPSQRRAFFPTAGTILPLLG